MPLLLTRRDFAISCAAGVAITVLVSWVLALHAVPTMQTGEIQNGAWPARAPDGWPSRARFVSTSEKSAALGGLWFASGWGNQAGDSAGDYVMVVTRSGWPMLAMESRLTQTMNWRGRQRRWDNEHSLAAGLFVPLHQTRPHPEGDDGWASRRLPLKPLPLGFAVNSALATLFMLGLAWARRMHALGTRDPLYGRVPIILACAIGVNVAVSLSLWAKWQFASKPRATEPLSYRSLASVEVNALRFQGDRASWPAKVPEVWPKAPSWIGSGGEALGVRSYELTSHGIPAAAFAWLHVTWGFGASDVHQNMHVVQAGWPLPSLQSEELIEVQGRGEKQQDDSLLRFAPIERRGAVWNVKLPGAPAPSSDRDPAAIIPIRPLWLGSLANIVLFACVLSLLAWLPTALRVFVRSRKHRCIACGYEAQDSERCPECGQLTRVKA